MRTAIANAIILAINDGNPGDVILLETQMYVCGVGAYGPSEFDQTVFDAIQTATANGFVVVEAAGNGAVNLDRAECNNNINRSVRDSGAIIVGAGASARRVEARERLWFSSYGDRVDMQGWGNDVCTTGYGDKFKDPADAIDWTCWYTGIFSGTSSASPIVAGAVANLQGIAKDVFGTPLLPFQVRQVRYLDVE